MISIGKPRAVVCGKNDQRIVSNSQLLQSLVNLADGPIDFHHNISEEAPLTLSPELVGDVQGNVDHAMGYIQEERLIFVATDEIDSALGIGRR